MVYPNPPTTATVGKMTLTRASTIIVTSVAEMAKVSAAAAVGEGRTLTLPAPAAAEEGLTLTLALALLLALAEASEVLELVGLAVTLLSKVQLTMAVDVSTSRRPGRCPGVLEIHTKSLGNRCCVTFSPLTPCARHRRSTADSRILKRARASMADEFR
jgi:hypothetical protein